MEAEESGITLELDLKRRQYVSYMIYSTLLIHFFYLVLSYFLDFGIVAFMSTLSILVTVYLQYFFAKLEFDFNFLTDFGLFTFSILVYLYVLLLWDVFPIIYMLFFSIPLVVFMVQSYKNAIYWTIGIVCLSFSAPYISFFLSELFDMHFDMEFSTIHFQLIHYSIIAWSIFLILLALYFVNEFNYLKIKASALKVEALIKEDQYIEVKEETIDRSIIEADNETSDKLDELYVEIEKRFLEHQTYRDPDYSINKLAADLNTNVTYISKVLNSKKGVNFKHFINSYRIKEIKEKLIAKEHDKFTLKHIYNDAGFSSQSTFNRAFKEIEGLTPSEFIHTLNN